MYNTYHHFAPGTFDPSTVIPTLASAMRVRPETCLGYAASILGGVAGPVAGLNGPFSERHQSGLSMVVATDGHSSRRKLLETTFLEPLLRFSDLSRLASKSCHPGVLSSYDAELKQCSHPSLRSELAQGLIAQTKALVDEQQQHDFADSIGQAAQYRRRLSQLQQPSLVLCSPCPNELQSLMDDVLDGHALVVDPTGLLIEKSLPRGKTGAPWRGMLNEINKGQGYGFDRLVDRTAEDGPGIAQRTRTPFLLSTDWKHLTQAMMDQDLNKTIGYSLIIRPSAHQQHEDQINWDHVKSAAKQYRAALKSIILARRNGCGIVYQISSPEPGFLERLDAFHARLDGLGSDIAPFCRSLYRLPYELLWAQLVLVGKHLPKECHNSFHIPVMDAADYLLDEHISALRLGLEEESLRTNEKRLADLYQRIHSKGPCTFRDVLRSFRVQRKSEHEPYLHQLLDLGAVRYRDNNLLETVDGAAPPWDRQRLLQCLS